MLHYIYTCPLIVIILFMVLALAVWGGSSAHIAAKHWHRGNLVLTILMAAAILYATILTRSEGSSGEYILQPFAALLAARQQPELYREMVMNIFLFFPFGLALSNTLPRRWRRRYRIVLTTLIGCLFSGGIEYGQYRFALGLAEADDVICNTLGAFLGSLSVWIASDAGSP